MHHKLNKEKNPKKYQYRGPQLWQHLMKNKNQMNHRQIIAVILTILTIIILTIMDTIITIAKVLITPIIHIALIDCIKNITLRQFLATITRPIILKRLQIIWWFQMMCKLKSFQRIYRGTPVMPIYIAIYLMHIMRRIKK